MNEKIYDLGIAGGGLAGLSLAILQAREGKSVILFEKKSYPFHRVCGEYISMESWDFLEHLGLPLTGMNLPLIHYLQVSSPSGTYLETKLDLGGFGISRYKLDAELAEIASGLGVEIQQNTEVKEIKETSGRFEIETESHSFSCRQAVGSFGKRSGLDVHWNRPFVNKNRTSLNQYIGVKYHIQTEFPLDKIALHNFSDGYFGISAVEDGNFCLCYMTTKENLKKSGNSIPVMEDSILSKNPFLREIFRNGLKLWPEPEVIAQVSFEKKGQFEKGIPLIGDAAGMIAPLCGNGMSMAFHAAFLLHQLLLSGQSIGQNYVREWNKLFSRRLLVGRTVQRLFGNPILTDFMIRSLRQSPALLRLIIKNTHGKNIL